MGRTRLVLLGVLLLVLFSCKRSESGSTKKRERGGTVDHRVAKEPKTAPTMGPRAPRGAKATPKKSATNATKKRGALFLRVRLDALLQTPFLARKHKALKAAALKRGYLGTLLRCGLDFTTGLKVLAVSLPQEFRRTKQGGVSLMGSFDGEQLARCLIRERNFTITKTLPHGLHVEGAGLKLVFAFPGRGLLKIRTAQGHFAPHDTVPNSFRQLGKDLNTLPVVVLGTENPSLPWPSSPTAIVVGLDPHLDHLQVRAVLNFPKEKGAVVFARLVQAQISKVIKKEGSTPPGLLVSLLKKVGMKRYGSRLLASTQLGWKTILQLIQLTKINVTAKHSPRF